jgi:hypothetical protein
MSSDRIINIALSEGGPGRYIRAPPLDDGVHLIFYGAFRFPDRMPRHIKTDHDVNLSYEPLSYSATMNTDLISPLERDTSIALFLSPTLIKYPPPPG